MTPFGDRDVGQHWLRYQGIITWTNVDWSSVKSSDIHIRAIWQEMPQPSITKICLKIICLNFHSNFPGPNERMVVKQPFMIWVYYLQGPFYLYRITLTPAWMSNFTYHKIWDGITYLFPKFNNEAVEVWEWISNFIPDFIDYLSMLGSKSINISERPPGVYWWLVILPQQIKAWTSIF